MNSPQELCTGSAAGVLKWSIEPTAVRVPCSWRRSLGNISDKRIAALYTAPYTDYLSSGFVCQILFTCLGFESGGGYFGYCHGQKQ